MINGVCLALGLPASAAGGTEIGWSGETRAGTVRERDETMRKRDRIVGRDGTVGKRDVIVGRDGTVRKR